MSLSNGERSFTDEVAEGLARFPVSVLLPSAAISQGFDVVKPVGRSYADAIRAGDMHVGDPGGQDWEFYDENLRPLRPEEIAATIAVEAIVTTEDQPEGEQS